MVNVASKRQRRASRTVEKTDTLEASGHVRPEPCRRGGCGGTVMAFDTERRCILCARPDGAENLPDVLPYVRGGKRKEEGRKRVAP
jgi:hypothetical protein